MTEEETSVIHRGRTWADVFVGATYITTGIVFLLILGLGIYFFLGTLPNWFFLSIILSTIFIPFLNDRAKDGADLFLVSDGPFRLTEYRVGRKVGLEIEGVGSDFRSKSGVTRTILTDLNVDQKKAIGSPFGDMTQIDQVRDLTTLTKISNMLYETLKESRISAQTVGIEVEKQSIEIVDWALKTIYGAIIPTEISESFGLETKEESLEVDLTEDEIIEVEIDGSE